MSKFNIVCNETHYDKDSDSLVTTGKLNFNGEPMADPRTFGFTKRRPGKPTISIVGGVKDNLMAKVIAEVDRGINEFERQEAIDKALGGTEHDADERSADGPEL